MASSISAARASLFSLLSARAWPAPAPQVTFGAPAAYEDQEVVALLGIEASDEENAVMGGARPRDEEFTIVVAVKVHDPAADTAAAVDARGWVLADGVRDTVYTNLTLGSALTPSGWARVASQTSAGAQSAEGGGWVIFIEVRVLCRARVN